MGTRCLPEWYQRAVWEANSTVRVDPSYQATGAGAQHVSGKSRSSFSVGNRLPLTLGRPF